MWTVYEEDESGEGISHTYRTREQVRAHLRRIRNNIFLRGWLARGFNRVTLSYA